VRGSLFYGLKGRMVSGVAGFAGILSAAVSAAQQANLVSLFPPHFNKWFTVAAGVSFFFTLFNERIQGGASRANVRQAAEFADRKNLIEETNKRENL
jgi:hypothetical protein